MAYYVNQEQKMDLGLFFLVHRNQTKMFFFLQFGMKQGASSTLFFILLLPVPNLPLKNEMYAKKRYYDTAASNQRTGDPNAFVSFAPV